MTNPFELWRDFQRFRDDSTRLYITAETADRRYKALAETALSWLKASKGAQLGQRGPASRREAKLLNAAGAKVLEVLRG